MRWKYLIISSGGYSSWGKHELAKDYFVAAVQRGDMIINIVEGTCFDKDKNAWVPVEGDK